MMNVENGELEKQLAEIVKLGKDGAIKAADFIQQQAPELVEQMLRWHFWSSLTVFVIGAAMIVAFVALLIVGIRKERDWWFDHYGPRPTLLVPVFSILVGLVLALCSTQWLQIWIAPKLYVFEWCQTLLK
jgi:hypothetical protein